MSTGEIFGHNWQICQYRWKANYNLVLLSAAKRFLMMLHHLLCHYHSVLGMMSTILAQVEPEPF